MKLELNTENSTALQYINYIDEAGDIDFSMLCYLITYDFTQFVKEDIPEFEDGYFSRYRNHFFCSGITKKDLNSGVYNAKKALQTMVIDLIRQALNDARIKQAPVILPKCYFNDIGQCWIEFLQKEYI